MTVLVAVLAAAIGATLGVSLDRRARRVGQVMLVTEVMAALGALRRDINALPDLIAAQSSRPIPVPTGATTRPASQALTNAAAMRR